MNITFRECRYILHLKDYDSGVFFYREVLGLQPNYNWSIVPDQKATASTWAADGWKSHRSPLPPGRDTVSFWPSAPTCPCAWSGFWRKCPTSRFSLRMPGR